MHVSISFPTERLAVPAATPTAPKCKVEGWVPTPRITGGKDNDSPQAGRRPPNWSYVQLDAVHLSEWESALLGLELALSSRSRTGDAPSVRGGQADRSFVTMALLT